VTISDADLRAMMLEMSLLERAVDVIVDKPLPDGRVTELHPGVAMTWLSTANDADMEPKEATWVAQSGDFNATGIGYAVWMSSGSYPAVRMIDTGSGFLWSEPRQFDFQWNFRRNFSTSWYGTPAQGDLLTHRVLGNMERARPLTFERSWKIAMGDGLTFRVKPTAMWWGGTDYRALPLSPVMFTVHLFPYGFRSGGVT
jgi:hypothetical protein